MRVHVLLLSATLVAFAADAQATTVTIGWSLVGNPGNPNDPATGSVFGGVNYNYRIGTYDVTNDQYAEFLNAKAASDSLALYNPSMGSGTGGITRSGSNGSYTYVTISGRENLPVVFVSWYSAVRFANWLNNGGGNADTETGAYTLLGGTPLPTNGLSITRNAGATVFLPSESEWYKAAYYSPATSSYFQYPTSSNGTPIATVPTAAPNSANYDNVVGDLTNVGAYAGTTSPYGAFDMGGNVFQWNETLNSASSRGNRGSSCFDSSAHMLPSFRGYTFGGSASDLGFRVASIPEPSALVLCLLGAVGVYFLARKRRR